jgi:VanZ family protein
MSNKLLINTLFTRKRLKTALIVYTIILILLSVLPINSTSSTINHTYVVKVRLDYLLHYIVFFSWMFFVWIATNVSFRTDFRKTTFIIFLCLLFAFANELIQYFLPYRAFNINDLVANSIGVLLGSILFLK